MGDVIPLGLSSRPEEKLDAYIRRLRSAPTIAPPTEFTLPGTDDRKIMVSTIVLDDRFYTRVEGEGSEGARTIHIPEICDADRAIQLYAEMFKCGL